ncbi:MAG: hypothetical protein QOJ12_74, partial [Thermoleophilales bacterium]|nr:hypothetical protein [Thermoleophilales bacterium]
MGHAIATLLGWAVLAGAAGALLLVLLRGARDHGILAPVAVGLGVRLAVMLVAHGGSTSLGDGGFFYLDDQTYMRGATRLAHLWAQGSLPDPGRYDVVGTHLFGYQFLVAVLFGLGTTSVVLGKLANVLIGAVTVYLVARIAGRVLGEQAQVRGAWLAALAPSLVWWSAPLMKEAVVTMAIALGVFAATTLPRRLSAATFGVALAMLVLLRI